MRSVQIPQDWAQYRSLILDGVRGLFSSEGRRRNFVKTGKKRKFDLRIKLNMVLKYAYVDFPFRVRKLRTAFSSGLDDLLAALGDVGGGVPFVTGDIPGPLISSSLVRRRSV